MQIKITHNNYSVTRIEPDMVDATLPYIEPILKLAVPYTAGFTSIYQMIDTMRQGARPWQMWFIRDGDNPVGGFLSTLERVGDELVFQFEILAGTDAQGWIIPIIDKFEQYLYARYGVTQVRIVGREGWSRFLASKGYMPQAFITAKRRIVPDMEMQNMLNGPATYVHLASEI